MEFTPYTSYWTISEEDLVIYQDLLGEDFEAFFSAFTQVGDTYYARKSDVSQDVVDFLAEVGAGLGQFDYKKSTASYYPF